MRWVIASLVVLGALEARPAAADPLAAELLYPTNGNMNVDLSRPFYWAQVSAAQAYYLTIGSAPGKADLFSSGETTVTSMLIPKSLPKGKTIYARLWTKSAGAMRYSADVAFAVANAVPSPTPTPTPTPPAPTPTPTPTPTPQTTPIPPSTTPTPTPTPTATATPTPTPAPPITTSFASGSYPVVWEGNGINFSGDVGTLSFFTPLFGAERAVVNPAAPQVLGSRVVFSKAGEYYLTVGGSFHVKVLVLSVNEPISSAVVRLFDFMRANLLFDTCHDDTDAAFYSDQEGFAQNFFLSEEPAALLCGPTHSLFQRIVTDVLGLPTRKPALVGDFRWSDENCNVAIYQFSHNPLEVYLPDIGKWALFDLNFGFLVKWLDATEIAEFTMAHPESGTLGYMKLVDFSRLNVYTGGPTTRLCRSAAPGEDPHPSVRNRVSNVPSAYLWRDLFRFYYGGVAYWGDTATFQMPHGTEFLSGDFIWASLHTDQILENSTKTSIEGYGLKVTIVSLDSLRGLLEAGHRPLILQEGWKSKIPTTVSTMPAGPPTVRSQPAHVTPRRP